MRRQRRGMTLLELIVAMAILVVVVAITMQVIVLGVNLARNGNEAGESNETARFAGDTIALQTRLAGMGASLGLNVLANGSPRTISPVLAVNSTTGPDELWVVAPQRNVFGAGCDGTSPTAGYDVGASAVVQQSLNNGILAVRCSNTLTFPSTLMVTNLSSAALIRATGTASSGAQINFAESTAVTGSGFTNNYRRGGFTAGDLVMPVNIWRYYVANYGPNNEPTLMVGQGVVNTGSGFPFTMVVNSERPLAGPIEDMQVQFGVDPSDGDDPSSVVWRNGAPCSGTCFSDSQGRYEPGARSIVLSIVSRSRKTLKDTSGTGNLAGLVPMSVFDHVIGSPVADGRRRVKYERRIELPNAAPGSM